MSRVHGPVSLSGVLTGLAVQAIPFTRPHASDGAVLLYAAVPTIGLAMLVMPRPIREFGVRLMASGIAYWFGLFGSLAVIFFFPMTLAVVAVGFLLCAVVARGLR